MESFQSDRFTAFFRWLQVKLSTSDIQQYKYIFLSISDYCLVKHVISCPLIQISDINKIKKIQCLVSQSSDFRKLGKEKTYQYGLILRLYSEFLMNNNSSNSQVRPSESNSRFEDRVHDAIQKRDPTGKFGVTISYLQNDLQCSYSKIKNLLDEVTWVTRRNYRYYLLELPSIKKSSGTAKPHAENTIKNSTPNVIMSKLESDIYNVLAQAKLLGKAGSSVTYVQAQLQNSDYTGIKQILDRVPWVTRNNHGYQLSSSFNSINILRQEEATPAPANLSCADIPTNEDCEDQQFHQHPVILINDAGNIDDSLPDYFEFSGKKESVTSWVDLLIKVCARADALYPVIFSTLLGTSLVGCSRVEIGLSKNYPQMKRPRIFSNGKYVETQMTPSISLAFIEILCKKLSLPPESLKIYLEYPDSTSHPFDEHDASISGNTPSGKGDNTLSITSQCKSLPQPKTCNQKDLRNHGLAPKNENKASIEEDFITWMQRHLRIAISTSKTYMSSIRTASIYAERHYNIENGFLTGNPQADEKIVNRLLSDPRFQKINKQQYSRFSIAIKHYLKYIEYRKRDMLSTMPPVVNHNSFPVDSNSMSSNRQEENEEVIDLILTDYSMHGGSYRRNK